MRVFQTLLAFGGNAQPQLAVTRELVRRGHEVRVLAHSAAGERVRQTGAELVPFTQVQPELDITLPERDTLRDWQARTRVGAGMRLMRNGLFAFVVGVSRECAKRLEEIPADVVLFDWMLTGAAVAAEGTGLPAVALVHCPYPLPLASVPPFVTGLQPAHTRLGTACVALLNRVGGALLTRGLPLVNKARAEQSLAPLRRFEQQLLGTDAICVLSAPELDFASTAKLPANVHYVGPAFEGYSTDWRPPWPEANTDPLVLISLSTSYMRQQALAQRILDAIESLPVRALLTTGPALDPARLSLPANTHAETFIPHRSVLPRAALVITHAGWQTINAALADGVPLLCIPDGRDQPGNAARVLAAGAGIRARKHASSRKLRALILRALEDPRLKQGAEAIATALARSDGAPTVAARLEQLVARDSAASTADV